MEFLPVLLNLPYAKSYKKLIFHSHDACILMLWRINAQSETFIYSCNNNTNYSEK